MKRLAPLALSLLLATGAFAQRGGMRGGFGGGMGRGGFHGGGGFRGGGFHGGGFHGGFPRGGFVHGGFRGVHGGFVRGHVGVAAPFGFGFNNGFVNPLFFNRALSHKAFFSPGFGFGFHNGFGFNNAFFDGGFGFGGFGFPIAVGGMYAYDPFYTYPYYPAEPNITVIGAPAQPSPPVVVQAYTPPQPVHSSIKEYGPAETPREPQASRAATGSEIYLLAFKDGVIRAALAYWMEGDTLHYVGTDRKPHEVPLTSINRDFSAQLNRERNVPFRLPAP